MVFGIVRPGTSVRLRCCSGVPAMERVNDFSRTNPTPEASFGPHAGRLLLDGTARLDSSGNLIEASVSLLHWLGVPGKELAGKPFWPEIWKSRPAWETSLRRLLEDAGSAPQTELQSEGQRDAISVQVFRTRQGSHARFRSLRPSADLRAETLARLAGVLRHDFNNLMTAVLGLTEGFQLQTEAGEPYHEGLMFIRNNATKARHIVERILDLYQARAGNREYYDAGEQAVGVIELVKKILPARLKLELTPTSESLPVFLDRVEFREALLELT